MNAFSKQLKKLRLEHGLSQSGLARIVNVDHTFINRLEHGERMPSREVAERLSHRLDHEGYPTLFIAAGYLPCGFEHLNGSLEQVSGAIQVLVLCHAEK